MAQIFYTPRSNPGKPGTNLKKPTSGEQNYRKQKILKSDKIHSKSPLSNPAKHRQDTVARCLHPVTINPNFSKSRTDRHPFLAERQIPYRNFIPEQDSLNAVSSRARGYGSSGPVTGYRRLCQFSQHSTIIAKSTRSTSVFLLKSAPAHQSAGLQLESSQY